MFENGFLTFIIAGAAMILIWVSMIALFSSMYKRCPPDQVLVVYGNVGKGESARYIHGGGTMVMPILQASAYLSLAPMKITIPMTALRPVLPEWDGHAGDALKWIIAISIRPQILDNAARRLLHLRQEDIAGMAREVILGQTLLAATETAIERIDKDTAGFLESVGNRAGGELSKLGLEVVNVSISEDSETNRVGSADRQTVTSATFTRADASLIAGRK
jgi:flotillin